MDRTFNIYACQKIVLKLKNDIQDEIINRKRREINYFDVL